MSTARRAARDEANQGRCNARSASNAHSGKGQIELARQLFGCGREVGILDATDVIKTRRQARWLFGEGACRGHGVKRIEKVRQATVKRVTFETLTFPSSNKPSMRY